MEDRPLYSAVLDDKASNEPAHGHLRLYITRWLILLIYCICMLMNGVIFISLAAVTDIVIYYYGVSAAFIDLQGSIFFLVFVLFSIPVISISSKVGLRGSIILGASFNAISASLRFSGSGQFGFYFVAIGQCFAALANVFLLSVPPKLAAAWFGDHERAKATAMCFFVNMLGTGFGWLHSTLLIEKTEDKTILQSSLKNVFMQQLVVAMTCLVLVYAVVRDQPKTPPSVSQTIRYDTIDTEHEDIQGDLRKMLRDKNYVLLSIIYGINVGAALSIGILLNQLIRSKYPSTRVSESGIGFIGFAANICSVLGCFIAGVVQDYSKHYKACAIVIMLGNAATFGIWGIVFMSINNVYVVGCIFALYSFFNFSYLSYGIQQIAEVTYPIPENVSGTPPMLISNLMGIFFIQCFQLLIDEGNISVILILYFTFYCCAVVLSCVAKTEMRRSQADQCYLVRHDSDD